MVWGKKARLFSDYVMKNKIDINSMNNELMKKIARKTGLSFHYIEVLKSRYRTVPVKEHKLIWEDIDWALRKFESEYSYEVPECQGFDFEHSIPQKYKKVMCEYLFDRFGVKYSIETFDKVRLKWGTGVKI